jgi:hypothetical protein
MSFEYENVYANVCTCERIADSRMYESNARYNVISITHAVIMLLSLRNIY